MRSVEASAATRKEAIDSALQELGAEMHDVENIEVLDEGSKGLFGFGAREVKVRVTADAPAPRKPAREERGGRGDGGERGEGGGRRSRGGRNRGKDEGRKQEARSEKPGESENKENREEKGEGRRRSRGGRNRNRNRDNGRDERKQDGNRAEGRPDNRGGNRRERGNNDRPERAPRAQRETSADQDKENFVPITDEQGREAAAILQEIIVKMGMEATVEFVRMDEGASRLNVTSEDGGILIGRKGRTLSDLQYLINRIISQTDTTENAERVVVDVEGYLDRRKEMLEEMAQDFAAKAKDTGRNMKLKPMSPQERRIVHVALADDEEIRTFSLGDSLYRCVVISPKNGSGDERPRRGGGGGRGRGRDRQEERSPYESDNNAYEANAAENTSGEQSDAAQEDKAQRPRRRGGRRRAGGLRGAKPAARTKDSDFDAGTFGD